jgi:hypothetical protein
MFAARVAYVTPRILTQAAFSSFFALFAGPEARDRLGCGHEDSAVAGLSRLLRAIADKVAAT